MTNLKRSEFLYQLRDFFKKGKKEETDLNLGERESYTVIQSHSQLVYFVCVFLDLGLTLCD